MALETLGDATRETGTREAMTPQSFDEDDAETRLVEITLPELTWFRLDRFTKCQDGWTFEDILLEWLHEWEARERDADRAAVQNLTPGGS